MPARFLPVLVALFVLLMAVPAFAAPRDAKVNLQTKQTASVVSGDTAWVALNWRARNGAAGQFHVTVDNPPAGVQVGYPANTATHSSLMADDELSAGEIDFTALEITVPYTITSTFTLDVNLSYVTRGKPKTKRVRVKVPVVVYDGADVQQVSNELGSFVEGEGGWVGVQYTGLAPRLDTFSVVVTDPAGVPITYPAEGTSTSLHHDALLEDLETDIVRFRVDTGGLAPGIHTLEVTATYSRGATTGTLIGTATLQVLAAG